MNRITEVTKRDIYELFLNGMDIDILWDTQKIRYLYHGRLNEFDFLKKIYSLKDIPSIDPRYQNAEEDIWQHTINNSKDYLPCWVFEDERFPLKKGSDEDYLRFLCEIFHPVVRDEKEHWKEFLNEVNNLLCNDGYELFPCDKISNRDIYGWRIYTKDENRMFIPFSQRNKKAIKEKSLKQAINKNAREQIYILLERYNETYQETDETGWNDEVTTEQKVFSDINQFYQPKNYNEQGEYVKSDNTNDFICHTSPFCVFDYIEFFDKYNGENDFYQDINTLLSLNEIPFKLDEGKIVSTFCINIKDETIATVSEAGLKELLQEAQSYFNKGEKNIAVEKLWDAFERLKTFYAPELDKKKSLAKIIFAMAGVSSESDFYKLFNDEFEALTTIGNSFRIRHHEKNKIDIKDDKHYDYLYKRCLSLVTLAIEYLR